MKNTSLNTQLSLAAFAAGLLAIGWIALGYFGNHWLALSMTLLIGAVYVFGGVELLRFQRATSSLDAALAALPDTPASLDDWLSRLHPALRSSVRLRVEGERVGLPGPALTPYLVGLLVMLGMLGTFLGMVVTLNGAVLALESTTDLPTIRAALASPVKGLGLAFGTSVAGVAGSAMLGLVSALCRRERQQASLALDGRIARELRPFSLVQQRQETFKALQFQAQALPEVVDKLAAMMARLEQQTEQLNTRLLDGQERFYRDTEQRYGELARSVDHTLTHSLSESARLAGATIQPMVEETLRALTRHSLDSQDKLATAVQAQASALSAHLETAAERQDAHWRELLARQEAGAERQTAALGAQVAASAAHLESLASRLDRRWADLVTHQEAAAERHSATLNTQIQATAGHLDALATRLDRQWADALRRHEASVDQQAEAQRTRLDQLADKVARGATDLLSELAQSQHQTQARWQNEHAAQEQARAEALDTRIQQLLDTLQGAWRATGAQNLAQQQAICATLENTAQRLGEQTETQARALLGEIARVMHDAAEAPRAAAEVVGRLREELSQSMARDNALLDERGELLQRLATVLAAVDQSAGAQRAAAEHLLTSTATLLDRVATDFTARADTDAARLGDAAAQAGAGAIEMASLGEAFGAAVQLFGAASEKTIDSLQRIAGALDKSLTRSDEQLAYYVAQAREIVDLSVLSQQRMVEDLRRLAPKEAA